jgi:hypothetical protein
MRERGGRGKFTVAQSRFACPGRQRGLGLDLDDDLPRRHLLAFSAQVMTALSLMMLVPDAVCA